MLKFFLKLGNFWFYKVPANRLPWCLLAIFDLNGGLPSEGFVKGDFQELKKNCAKCLCLFQVTYTELASSLFMLSSLRANFRGFKQL